MTRPGIDDLVRMVEREIDPLHASAQVPDDHEDRVVSEDWEMLELLRELWRLQNPKPAGERRSHRRLLGPPVRTAKAGFRLLFQPFINEILERQASFNEAAVPLLEKMRFALLERSRRVEALAAENEDLSRRVAEHARLERRIREREDEAGELRERIRRLEAAAEAMDHSFRALEEAGRRERRFTEEFERIHQELLDELRRVLSSGDADDATVRARTEILAEGTCDRFDYARFHEGTSPESVTRELYAGYVDFFEGRRHVVDLGCGRGVFLELLAERGITAHGVDRDPRLVARAVAAGLDAREGDALAHLESLEPGDVDGVFLGHIVEHLDLERLHRLFRLAHERLAPGGVLVLESPNTANVLVLASSYFRDPSHRSPLHPDTYRFLLESAGFTNARLDYRFPTPEEYKLRPVAGVAELPAAAAERIDANTEKLNEILYGPVNFSIIAWKGSPER